MNDPVSRRAASSRPASARPAPASTPDVPVLICPCGKRLRAPGARPGRVGRCPGCGGELRVPEAARPAVVKPAPVSTEETTAPAPEPAPARKRRRKPKPGYETEIWNGVVKAPRVCETRLRESLLYPFWGANGVALLIFMPPLLWLNAVMTLGVAGGLSTAMTMVRLVSVIWMVPSSIGLLVVLGYTLLFLGRVLATSAIGEIHHPRWPEWELTHITFGLGRWLLAALAGGLVGGVPALTYWISCGDVDLFDAIILTELITAGSVYALMGLLASILHDDVRGANPYTVFKAIRAVGWSYVEPCLVAGFAAFLALTVLVAAFEVDSPLISAFLFWVFWLFGLYEAMVVLRVLGLFYQRHAAALGWFRGRTGWGA